MHPYPTINQNPIAYTVWSNPSQFEFIAIPSGDDSPQGWNIQFAIHPGWVQWTLSDSYTPAIRQAHTKLYRDGWRVIRADDLNYHSNCGYLVWMMKDSEVAWLLEGLPNGDAGFPSMLVKDSSTMPTVVRNQYGQVPA